MVQKTLESPLDSKEIKWVNPKENKFWIFIGRTYAEAVAPILWPPDVKSWLIGKDPDAGKDWRQEEKGMTEDEMVGWHHWLNGYEFEQALGDGERQGRLVYCSPWIHKESDTTDRLNNKSPFVFNETNEFHLWFGVCFHIDSCILFILLLCPLMIQIWYCKIVTEDSCSTLHINKYQASL